MDSEQHTVAVRVPVRTAYELWDQPENLPRFLGGVIEVRPSGDAGTRWITRSAGTRRDFDAEVVTQDTDRRLTWWSDEGPWRAVDVAFTTLGPDACEVTLTVDWRRDAAGWDAASAARRVREDLERFQAVAESWPVVSVSVSPRGHSDVVDLREADRVSADQLG